MDQVSIFYYETFIIRFKVCDMPHTSIPNDRKWPRIEYNNTCKLRCETLIDLTFRHKNDIDNEYWVWNEHIWSQNKEIVSELTISTPLKTSNSHVLSPRIKSLYKEVHW